MNDIQVVTQEMRERHVARHFKSPTLIAWADRIDAAMAELVAERDRLQARLDTNRCNSGHETLPLTLWDCPECHNETKRKLAELIEARNAMAPLCRAVVSARTEVEERDACKALAKWLNDDLEAAMEVEP